MRGQGGMRPLIGGNDEGREPLTPGQAKFSFPCFFQFPRFVTVSRPGKRAFRPLSALHGLRMTCDEAVFPFLVPGSRCSGGQLKAFIRPALLLGLQSQPCVPDDETPSACCAGMVRRGLCAG